MHGQSISIGQIIKIETLRIVLHVGPHLLLAVVAEQVPVAVIAIVKSQLPDEAAADTYSKSAAAEEEVAKRLTRR